MAAHASKKLLLSLSRFNNVSAGLSNVSFRAAYATVLSPNLPLNKDVPERAGRGTFNKKPRREVGPPRTKKMAEDQDWTVVYPAAAPFRPGTVPLPVRMGYPVRGGVPPEKQGNLELIKIPNFLHLTPAAIKKHCEALKPFCNEWPSTLDTDAKCEENFPIRVESNDYLSAGPSVRNPAARVVQLRLKLSSLNLDDHARKKMLKLVGDRYCKDTDILTITTDSCPLRKQNYDYAMYLLTVLYHESWKTEAWEADKTVADMEEYSWEDSPSQKNILDTLLPQSDGGEEERQSLLARREMEAYKDSVTRLKNQGDSESAVHQYKEAVKNVLKL
ncbi:small ribosomal subunit protein mS35 [Stigmatopora nigra]